MAKTSTPRPADKTTRAAPAKRASASNAKKARSATPKSSVTLSSDLDALLAEAPRAPFPTQLMPMLATLVDAPFDSPEWSYEVKWDGYRAVAFINHGKVELQSRNAKSFNEKFYSIHAALEKWPTNAVLDGEIVVTDRNGRSNFSALQNWRSEADGMLIYYIFDVLWLSGRDLSRLPLHQRRAILHQIVPEKSSEIRVSESFGTSGQEAYKSAVKLGLEGIMAKRNESIYVPGERSKDWLKVKAQKRQEMVIGGYTLNEGTSKPFSSLLVGVFQGDQLHFSGKVGTGFTQAGQRELLAQFQKYITERCPFTEIPEINNPSRFRPNPPKATAVWLRPGLVCEVSFTEMTPDGVLRHPSFQGLRTDKAASEVVQEVASPAPQLTPAHQSLVDRRILAPNETGERRSLLNPTDESQVRVIDGRELKLAHLSKYYWTKEKITKRDLLNYYYQAAPYILPYLRGRPLSLHRYPNGIDGISFFQKDVKGKVPDWIDTLTYYSAADAREKEFSICNDEASLLYLASLGSIEFNPWSSRKEKPDHPDWCVIDLDPDQNTFTQVITAAQETRELLDAIGVPSYCKTSGSTGLHLYIPLGAQYTYEQSKEFARAIVTRVHARLPKYTSIERHTADRGGRMYLDFLQNRPQATIAAPYSVRPKPGATVSMPLEWDEVKPGLRLQDFTLRNAIARVREKGDLFQPVLGPGIDLPAAVKRLESIP